MRRFFCFLLAALCFASAAIAAPSISMETMNALLDIMPMRPEQKGTFNVSGVWVAATMSYPESGGTQWDGMVFSTATKAQVVWDEVFADGDAAAAKIQEIAEASDDGNAYAEDRAYAPLPRDRFVVAKGQLTVFYPMEQVKLLSDHSGAISVFPFEVAGLYLEGIPFAAGDPADAQSAKEQALESGTLPGVVEDYPLGSPVRKADEALRLVDVPDLTLDAAVYRFEAPMMRGICLLSSAGDDNPETAAITGQFATRFDFSGLATGEATPEDCVAALGSPDEEAAVTGANAYSRLPDGQTLTWRGHGRALSLHFVGNVLHSVALLADE